MMPAPVFAVKAFPTAEGYGQFAKGGRGGVVRQVTNLNDAGAGSLRACAEASGPRTCVFTVSGTISLNSAIRIDDPYITIAGQTSPGGIQIRAGQVLNGPIYVFTHDVIIRHIRVRTGPTVAPSSSVDTISIFPPAHDVILDHVSLSWGPDETINSYTPNTTVQWSIISETLNFSSHGSGGGHSKGTLLTGQGVTLFHNILAHHSLRNPEFIGGHADYINNIAYDGGERMGENYNRYQPGLTMNLVGNFAALGPATRSSLPSMDFLIYESLAVNPIELYVEGNLDWYRTSDSEPEDAFLEPNDRRFVFASPRHRGLSVARARITEARQAARDTLAFAGATVPARDAVDQRIVSDVRNCRGGIIDQPLDVGGWPSFPNRAAPVDADKDGMADSWETNVGLDPADRADRNGDADDDGYTNLEEYLNELAGDQNRAGRPKKIIGTGTGTLPSFNCGKSVASAPPKSPDMRVTASAGSRSGDFITVNDGGRVTVSWSASPSEAETCNLKYFSSSDNRSHAIVGFSGSITDAPGPDGSDYMMSCVGNNGMESLYTVAAGIKGSLYLIDGQGGAPKVVTVTASPSSIRAGQRSTIKWSSPNAETCAPVPIPNGNAGLVQWSTRFAKSGTVTVEPTRTTTYYVSCLTGGETVGSVTVKVTP